MPVPDIISPTFIPPCRLSITIVVEAVTAPLTVNVPEEVATSPITTVSTTLTAKEFDSLYST